MILQSDLTRITAKAPQVQHNRSARGFWLTILATVLVANPASAADPLSVLRMTPSGDEVPAPSQIVVEFNKPMVALGRMDRNSDEVPILIQPTLNCSWRWITLSTIACQLSDADRPKVATRYSVTVKQEMRAEDGSSLAGPYTGSFVTQLPAVSYAFFRRWLSPTSPAYSVTFNTEVQAQSVSKGMVFVANGKKIPVKVTAVNAWDAVHGLPVSEEAEEEEVDDDQDEGNEGIPLPTPTTTPTPGTEVVVNDTSRTWVVEPIRSLPASTEVTLQSVPGLLAASGGLASKATKEEASFSTFPEFQFLGVRCSDLGGDELRWDISGTPPETSGCDPLAPVTLIWSSPALKESVARSVKFSPDLAGGRTDFNPWDDVYWYSRLESPRDPETTGEYELYLPGGLKADQTYNIEIPAGGVTDEFNRTTKKAVQFSFRTAHRKPNMVFDAEVSTLESQVNSHLPVAVTNLDALTLRHQTLMADGTPSKWSDRTIPVDRPGDIAYYHPLKIREILGGRSGVVKGYLDRQPAGDQTAKLFLAQVTPFAVLVKYGHFNSVVWVTDMATGAPVADASVTFFSDKVSEWMSTNTTALATASTNPDGIAELAGSEKIDPKLELSTWWPWGSDEKPILWAKVVRGSDLAIVPLIYQTELNARAAGNEWISRITRPKFGHLRAWGTTPQGVYKVGETIQFKVIVRNQDTRVFQSAPTGPYTLVARDPMDREVFRKEGIELSAFGSFSGEYFVPAGAAVGTYRFMLEAPFLGKDAQLKAFDVLVSDFTPSPFRVTTEMNAPTVEPGQTVKVSARSQLHAGGPYSLAKTRLTGTIVPKTFPAIPAPFHGMVFSSYEREGSQSGFEINGVGGEDGTFFAEALVPQTSVAYGTLSVEGAVEDDRGRRVAGIGSAIYKGRDRYIGLRLADWILTQNKPTQLEAAIADGDGKTLAGVEGTVTMRVVRTKAVKVKSSGNAYVSKYTSERVVLGECRFTSGATPSPCSFTPPEPGRYEFVARVVDTKGRPHVTKFERYVVGSGNVLWEEEEGTNLDVMPDKAEYVAGETARFLVKNPLPGALALITLERYGIQRSFVKRFESNTEVIEIPITSDQMPGFYLSVALHSPRVDKPVEDGGVDLGKPALRMGYAVVPVRDSSKKVTPQVVSNKSTYAPGESVQLTVSAESRVRPQEPVEVAVAVLDEAVFDLLSGGLDYFDPFKGFYTLESLDVRSFDLLRQIVGRRVFEKKGANSGGDGGGKMKLRSVDKYVAYWNPSVVVEPGKPTSVSFAAPDNLTGWKILAFANDKTDQFGLGTASFTVNKDLEIRKEIVNQVIEGDEFSADFTVMNRTQIVRSVKVTATTKGAVVKPGETTTNVTLNPFERRKISVPVRAASDGEIAFELRASDGTVSDGLRTTLKVLKRASPVTSAVYGSTDSDPVTVPVSVPDKIRGDVGGYSVSLAPTILSGLDGAFAYMRDYPYGCWEQRLSIAVMAATYGKLSDHLVTKDLWPGAAKLPAEILGQQAIQFQAPNGGMAYFTPRDDYADPFLSAYTGVAFGWLEEMGFAAPDPVRKQLDNYLENLLRSDEMPGHYNAKMKVIVRSAALTVLARRKRADPTDLQRVLKDKGSAGLLGTTFLIEAASHLGADQKIITDLMNTLLARGSESGGKWSFSEEKTDGYERMLWSSLRDNCAVMSVLMMLTDRPELSKVLADKPAKVAQFISQSRGSRTHWENTQENVFCTAALAQYAKRFENVAPALSVSASFDGKKFGEGRFTAFRDPPQTFERPIGDITAGSKHAVKIDRDGQGRVYYATKMTYAPIALPGQTNAGMEVVRQFSVEKDGGFRLLKDGVALKRGDLLRVDLYVSLPSPRNFVVVDDPVPGGVEPVNRDLANVSRVDAQKGEAPLAGNAFFWSARDWFTFGATRWSFYHRELRHDRVRFYADYLPAGRYHLTYVAQVIGSGSFVALPTLVEEMYNPDVFGSGEAEVVLVE